MSNPILPDPKASRLRRLMRRVAGWRDAVLWHLGVTAGGPSRGGTPGGDELARAARKLEDRMVIHGRKQPARQRQQPTPQQPASTPGHQPPSQATTRSTPGRQAARTQRAASTSGKRPRSRSTEIRERLDAAIAAGTPGGGTWTVRALAKAAGCAPSTAHDALKRHRTQAGQTPKRRPAQRRRSTRQKAGLEP